MESCSKTGGGPPVRPVPKPISRSPAAAPLFRPTQSLPQVGAVFHGGPRIQQPWLKKVNNAHDRISFLHKSNAKPKSGSSPYDRPTAGLPPPIAEVLQSESLLALWAARWTPGVVTAKDLRGEMNTGMICGRPVQVLCCSHNHAPPLEWDAYLNLAFFPLRPVVLCGPSAGTAEAPRMQHKFSVIQWWKVIVFFLVSLCRSPVTPFLCQMCWFQS